jgi:hypothetical protein
MLDYSWLLFFLPTGPVLGCRGFAERVIISPSLPERNPVAMAFDPQKVGRRFASVVRTLNGIVEEEKRGKEVRIDLLGSVVETI